ncbi:CorA metal ion transporter [Dimargaris verticillata]|uniref:CorA metal ion transporter n=1 Tax=Dimargaris verticillata TaxID=2761393 RepID=A0A9W8E9B6_9FUNG|nr:CorA metal ion transporter [Dimargaris verticillata]
MSRRPEDDLSCDDTAVSDHICVPQGQGIFEDPAHGHRSPQHGLPIRRFPTDTLSASSRQSSFPSLTPLANAAQRPLLNASNAPHGDVLYAALTQASAQPDHPAAQSSWNRDVLASFHHLADDDSIVPSPTRLSRSHSLSPQDARPTAAHPHPSLSRPPSQPATADQGRYSSVERADIAADSTSSRATARSRAHAPDVTPCPPIDFDALRLYLGRDAHNATVDAGQTLPKLKQSPTLRHRARSSLDPILKPPATEKEADDTSSLVFSVSDEYYGRDDQPHDPSQRFMLYTAATGALFAPRLSELRQGERGADVLMQDASEDFFWLDIMRPTQLDMDLLTNVFHIHPLTEEDILTEESREKCEMFRHYYFTCFHTYSSNPDAKAFMEPVSLFMVVMPGAILSFHHCPMHHQRNVLQRMRTLADSIPITPDWVNYALIDDITDSLSPLVELVSQEVKSIDELVLILRSNEQADMLQRIGAARKKVMAVQRLVSLKGYVIKALIKRFDERRWDTPASGIKFYYSDVLDHIITMLQDTNQFDSIVHRAHANFLAQISLEITISSNRASDIMAKVTALGTVLLPMNVVTGLFGMNVQVPGQDLKSYAWFGGILGILGLIFLVCSFFLYKFKILK